MVVYSMTGYASAQAQLQGMRLGLEIRSVNGRFLDVYLRLPDALRAVESALRQRLEAALKRGKVEVRLSIEAQANGALGHMEALLALQNQVLVQFPQARTLSVADVLRLAQTPLTQQPDTMVWSEGSPAFAQLLDLLEQVLQQLQHARANEGERILQLLQGRIDALRALVEQAKPLLPELVATQRKRFLQRWQEALNAVNSQATSASKEGLQVQSEQAQERALNEAASFALRIDVAEELDRLQAHLNEMQSLLSQGGVLGKRLDFLLQELHREANTLGSKSAVLALSRISMEMKVLIEQMREQVQNIE